MARVIPFNEAFQDNWRDRILSYADDGLSDVEIRAEMGVTKDLWYNYLDEDRKDYNLDFAETIKEAHDRCEAWWRGQGRKNLAVKEFNSTLWLMNMVNRFNWTRDSKPKDDVLDMAKLLVELAKGREGAVKSCGGGIA